MNVEINQLTNFVESIPHGLWILNENGDWKIKWHQVSFCPCFSEIQFEPSLVGSFWLVCVYSSFFFTLGKFLQAICYNCYFVIIDNIKTEHFFWMVLGWEGTIWEKESGIPAVVVIYWELHEVSTFYKKVLVSRKSWFNKNSGKVN